MDSPDSASTAWRLTAYGCMCDSVAEIAENSRDVDEHGATFAFVKVYISRQNDAGHPSGIPILQAVLRTLLLDFDTGTVSKIDIETPESQGLLLAALWAICPKNAGSSDQNSLFSAICDLGISSKCENMKDVWRSICPSVAIDKQWLSQDAITNLSTLSSPNLVEMSSSTHVLFSTEKGYLGYTQGSFQVGYFICVLRGCVSPLLLRKQADATFHSLVGSCFVLGFQYGEAARLVQAGSLRVRVLNLV